MGQQHTQQQLYQTPSFGFRQSSFLLKEGSRKVRLEVCSNTDNNNLGYYAEEYLRVVRKTEEKNGREKTFFSVLEPRGTKLTIFSFFFC